MAITKTVSVRLEVLVAPDFFPSINPTDLAVFKGIVAKYICSLVPNDTFTGRVRLSANLAGATFSKPEIGIGELSELTIDTSLLSVGNFDIEVKFEEV